MIATHAFRASNIKELQLKIETLINNYKNITSIQYKVFYNDNFSFAACDAKALYSKMDSKAFKKYFTEKGHFTVTFSSGTVTLSDFASNKVQWENS